MKVVLVHGMFRTPVAMALLGHRLGKAGFEIVYFGYTVVWESTEECAARLERRIAEAVGAGEEYALVGHSLGTVLIRMVLPRLARAPKACALIAPPSRACMAAKVVHERTPLFRFLTRDAGQLLASEEFMGSLPRPEVPTRLYAGTGGPRGRFSPFGDETNDSILTVDDTRIGPEDDLLLIPAIHSLIMNTTEVARNLIDFLNSPEHPWRGD